MTKFNQCPNPKCLQPAKPGFFGGRDSKIIYECRVCELCFCPECGGKESSKRRCPNCAHKDYKEAGKCWSS